jgi:Na+-transporting NADH:ubiquinone oxidoreductase subunit NqrF
LKLIGSGKFINDTTDPLKCMYKYNSCIENYDNLIVTGGHSILVDNLKNEQQEKQEKINFNYKIEDKQLSLAGFCDDFEQIKTNEEFTYYHIVLENNDEHDKYGIWANGGILTETCQRKYFLKTFIHIKK